MLKSLYYYIFGRDKDIEKDIENYKLEIQELKKEVKEFKKLMPMPEPEPVLVFPTIEPPVKKWVPKDSLERRFEDVSFMISKEPVIKRTINQSTAKIEKYASNLKSIEDKDDITVVDEFYIFEIKQNIMAEEAIISGMNFELGKINALSEDTILQDWTNYLEEAKQYIVENPILQKVVDANCILTTGKIKYKINELTRNLEFSSKSVLDETLHSIAVLKTYIQLETETETETAAETETNPESKTESTIRPHDIRLLEQLGYRRCYQVQSKVQSA